MKIGLLGGSFDPVHIGHIHIALSIMEERGLDKVVFVPTPLSPFKVENAPVASAKDRYAMVARAIEGIEGLAISDIEMGREGPCYTVDMVRDIKKADPENTYFLLLASDVLAGLSRWKEAPSLVEMVQPLIGRRPGGGDPDFHGFSPTDVNKIEKGFTKTPLLDISSTEIRSRLKQGLYVGHIVPGKVLDYIYEHRLYSSTI